MKKEHKYKDKDDYKDNDKDKDNDNNKDRDDRRITETLTVCYIFGIPMPSTARHCQVQSCTAQYSLVFPLHSYFKTFCSLSNNKAATLA